MYQKDGPSLVSLSHHSCMSKSLPTCTATVSYQHTILNVLSCPSRVVSKVNGFKGIHRHGPCVVHCYC